LYFKQAMPLGRFALQYALLSVVTSAKLTHPDPLLSKG